jgi:hypothetical protein
VDREKWVQLPPSVPSSSPSFNGQDPALSRRRCTVQIRPGTPRFAPWRGRRLQLITGCAMRIDTSRSNQCAGEWHGQPRWPHKPQIQGSTPWPVPKSQYRARKAQPAPTKQAGRARYPGPGPTFTARMEVWIFHPAPEAGKRWFKSNRADHLAGGGVADCSRALEARRRRFESGPPDHSGG